MLKTTKKICPPGKQTGFSLVEVLVSMLILAIGLLGLAALQTQGVRFNNDAFVRTQGATIAYDIIDKMCANRANAVQYTIFPARNALPPSGSYSWKPGETPYTCNPLAASVINDLAYWLNTVELVLPQGTATITQQAAPNDDLYTIKVKWLDRQIKITDSKSNPNFQLACQNQTNHECVTNPDRCLVTQTWSIWP